MSAETSWVRDVTKLVMNFYVCAVLLANSDAIVAMATSNYSIFVDNVKVGSDEICMM